ncbi:hypothetical protein [Prosthecomicrobium sp. N25]|uniref:hypothetical protein n=1 Tax=Prosthecomicrobium sp. N25 TaxID=3129254 RepID=UPI00307722BB
MPKYTPGPWSFQPGQNNWPHPSVWRGNEGGFQVLGTSRERSEADARLIAAAPDLLESLKDVVAVVQERDPGFDADVLRTARAVIARAEGR